MRNKLLIFALAFCLGGVGCTTHSKKMVEQFEPVEIPAGHFLTLSEQQLLLLDWHIAYSGGAHVEDKRVVPETGVEFDIYFPSNSPDCRSLDVVSSGKGGEGRLVGANIRGYKTFALKMTLVSVNGQSEPDMKQKIVAGALIGPTGKGRLCTYEPVILGLADSQKTVIAKTSVSAEKIYQIGFHIHMQNPQDWDRSGSIIRLRVEPVADNFTGTHFTTADSYIRRERR